MLRARTLKKSFKEPYNAKQTTPCSNRNGLSQKRPRPFLSICISSNVGSRKVFSPRFRIAVSHMVPSLTLSPSISSFNCSVFDSRSDSLPPIVPDPVPLSSCPVSPPPQTLIFSIATPEILLRPSVFRPRPERKRPPRRSSGQRHPHCNFVAEDNQRRITQTSLLTQNLSQIAFGHNRVLALCSPRKKEKT